MTTGFFEKYLKARFSGLRQYAVSGGSIYVLPREPKRAFGGLASYRTWWPARRLSHLNVPLVYRPSPTFGISSEDAAKSLDLLFASLWRLRGILPQGFSGLRLSRFFSHHGKLMNKYGAVLLQPEFARLIGENEISWKSFPNILPLHSVTTVEIVSRNLSRPTWSSDSQGLPGRGRSGCCSCALTRSRQVPGSKGFEQDLAYLRSLLERTGSSSSSGDPILSGGEIRGLSFLFLTASLYLLIFLASMEEEKVFVSTKWLLELPLSCCRTGLLGPKLSWHSCKDHGSFSCLLLGLFAATLAVLEAKKPCTDC